MLKTFCRGTKQTSCLFLLALTKKRKSYVKHLKLAEMKTLSERKAFNFYKSYCDVFFMLPEEERLKYITAILKKQFENKDPDDLEGLALFAYKSQEHSIKAQVEGFINQITKPSGSGTKGGAKGGAKGGTETPAIQEKGEGKEEEQEKEKGEMLLSKCVEIALLDEKYARLNKLVGPADFEPFIEKLETEGCYFKTPIDFKAHFARWKKKQPIAPKEIPIRPIREQDKWF
jgi:hypothetical protein